MFNDMTDVTLCGNVGSDPELRFTKGKEPLAVTNLRVARNTGEDSEDVEWYDVSVWRELAEHVVESVRTGDRVIVTGTIQIREWQDSEGNERTSITINARDVGLSMRWCGAISDRTIDRETKVNKAKAAKTAKSTGSKPEQLDLPTSGSDDETPTPF